MIKVVDPAGFNFDQPIMSLVDVHSRGVDSAWLRKSAAVLTREMSELRPEPNTTFVHLIALGDMERYGLNRNGDGFPKAANEKFHDTFVKHAHFFRHHKNKPELGHTIYGNVKLSAHNPEMHRVELVVGIDHKKAPDTIQKVAEGKDLNLSMACRVPHDFCTICEHQAPSTDKYCDCLKKHATQMLEDGRQVGMINTEPDFFDISEVVRNADRIALSLRKVASHGTVPEFSADIAFRMGVTEPASMNPKMAEKRAFLSKLASLERRLASEVAADAGMRLTASVLAESTGVTGWGGDNATSSLLGHLKSAGVVLSVPDFFRLVMGDRYSEVEADIPAAVKCASRCFSDAEKSPDEFLYGTTVYETVDMPATFAIKKAVAEIAKKAAVDFDSLGRRTALAALRKVASVMPVAAETEKGKLLAKEYARYKFASLQGADDYVVKVAVLQNMSLA